jgi:hypothetical protein
MVRPAVRLVDAARYASLGGDSVTAAVDQEQSPGFLR